MKEVVLYITHSCTPFINKQILKIWKETKGVTEFFVVYQADKTDMQYIDGVNYFPFTKKDLVKLGYVFCSQDVIPGNNHFILLFFYINHPNYDYYWNIEYDVCFSGHWKCLLSFYKNKKDDFITSHIETIRENPFWNRWTEMILVKDRISLDKYLKSFNPIYRISAKALSFINTFLKEGNYGHHELLLPTVLNNNGYTIRDFGENRNNPDDENYFKFYTFCKKGTRWYDGCSMRYRPLYKYDDMVVPQKLYHPVKYDSNFYDSTIMSSYNKIVESTQWLICKKITYNNFSADKGYIYAMLLLLNNYSFSNILDLGCGVTSLVLSQYKNKHVGTCLTIIESNEYWIRKVINDLPNIISINDIVLLTDVTDEMSSYLGLLDCLVKTRPEKKIDFISVDGPIGYNCRFFSRTNIVEIISNNLLDEKYAIMFHDTNRIAESNTVKWTKEILNKKRIFYKQYNIKYGKGTTILTNISLNICFQ